MNTLIGLLPEDDRDQLKQEMSSGKLDWQNPGGVTVTFFRVIQGNDGNGTKQS